MLSSSRRPSLTIVTCPCWYSELQISYGLLRPCHVVSSSVPKPVCTLPRLGQLKSSCFSVVQVSSTLISNVGSLSIAYIRPDDQLAACLASSLTLKSGVICSS
jgi:hypothetical protein